jgi:hypothetical protein
MTFSALLSCPAGACAARPAALLLSLSLLR